MTGKITDDQRGFSLIEFIVVIAIMGIVTAGGLISLSLVTGRNIKSCYSELDSYIQQTKTMCMSRSDAKLQIYSDTGGEVYVKLLTDAGVVSTKRIGKKGLTVSYEKSDGSAEVTITGTGNVLELGFDRSSGAFEEISSGVYCDKIKMTDGTRTYTMKLVAKTGKFYME